MRRKRYVRAMVCNDCRATLPHGYQTCFYCGSDSVKEQSVLMYAHPDECDEETGPCDDDPDGESSYEDRLAEGFEMLGWE
jgi:hypothetical protein